MFRDAQPAVYLDSNSRQSGAMGTADEVETPRVLPQVLF
jgi:hypothetical protein